LETADIKWYCDGLIPFDDRTAKNRLIPLIKNYQNTHKQPEKVARNDSDLAKAFSEDAIRKIILNTNNYEKVVMEFVASICKSEGKKNPLIDEIETVDVWTTLTKRYLPAYKKIVLTILEAIDSEDNRDAKIKRFQDAYKAIYKVAREGVKVKDKAALSNAKANSVLVSKSSIIEYCQETIKQLDSGTLKDWKRIALTLGFATGRRPGEICGDATFTLIDEAHLQFSGQLKTPESKTYSIPVVIITANQSILLIEKLETMKKRNLELKEINQNLSKQISDAVKPGNIQKWHHTRHFYALYNIDLLGGRDNQSLSKIQEIMGHSNAGNADIYDQITLVD